MMKRKKKQGTILALLLCFALMLGILPPQMEVRAADDNMMYLRCDWGWGETGVFVTHKLRMDLTMNLATGKATAEFTRLEQPQWDRWASDDDKENPYNQAIMENMSGQVTYDIEVVDLKPEELPEGMSPSLMDQGVKWALTNASGADSVILGKRNTSGYPLLHPYEIWLSPYLEKGQKYNGAVRTRPDNDDAAYLSYTVYTFKPREVEPEQPKVREYTMKVDNFGFKHIESNFLSASAPDTPRIYGTKSFPKGTYGYMLDGSDVVSMLSGRKQSQMAQILSLLSDHFGGACLGMSITSGLLFEEKIGLNQVGQNIKKDGKEVKDAYHLVEPVKNPDLLRTLIYYQIFANYERTNEINALRAKNDGMYVSQSNHLVELLKVDPYSPVVVCFDYYPKGEDNKMSCHAVLAFKLEEQEDAKYKYKISVYDPNDPDHTQYLYTSEPGTQEAPDILTGKDYGSIFVRAADRAEDLLNPSLTYPVPAEKHIFVRTKGNIKLVCENGTCTYVDGTKSGNLNVTAAQQDGGEETLYIVPVGSQKTVTVSNLGGTDTSIQTPDEFVQISKGVTEATINADGSVTAKTNGSEGTIAVASDKTNNTSGLFGTTVKTSAGEVTVTPTSKGANVKTDQGTSDITVSGKDDRATFGDVDTSKGADITTNGSNVTVSSEGRDIAKGTADENGGKTEKISDEPEKEPEDDPEDEPEKKPEKEPEKDPETGGRKSSFSAIPVTEEGTLYMVKGQSFTLPGGLTGWKKKDNSKAVTVTKAGKVTASNPGTAVIINEDAGKEYPVTVVLPELGKKNLSLLCGEKETLGISLKVGENDVSEHYAVSWFSNAPSIAQVKETKNGCSVSAVSPGNATITAYVNGKTYAAKVKVSETKTQKLTTENTALTLMPLQTVTLSLKGKKFAGCTWEGEGLKSVTNAKKTDYYNDVVYITSAGKLMAIGVGTVRLTCSNGVVIDVTVNEPVERKLYLSIGKKTTLKYSGVKSTKDVKPVWECSDTSGIIDPEAVKNNGTVIAKQAGAVLVTCNYQPYGDKSDGFTFKTRVYVENPAIVCDTELTQPKNQYAYELNLTGGDSKAIEFRQMDGYRLYQPVLFKSSKAAVAFVDENGVIYTSEVAKPTTVNLTCSINGKNTTIKVNLSPGKPDNDQTGFKPTDWNWIAEGEGYGKKSFTSGKYVREDGKAVLYIDSGDSSDGFSYQLFAMAEGSKQSNYQAPLQGSQDAYAWATSRGTGNYLADDTMNGLSFLDYRDGRVAVASDWIDEMVYEYGSPDGMYYLVREKGGQKK